ncbi:hypothetical protein EV426DRAFT_581646 [Tirmania nivea]|nr:hypothetical protein EV426DRAFT_581646 [Tirmania nivea]
MLLTAELQQASLVCFTEDGCGGYETKVFMGRNIGLVGNSSSGTMGGWFFHMKVRQIHGITAESGMQLVQPSHFDHDPIFLELEEEAASFHRLSERIGFMYPTLEANRLIHVQKLAAYKTGCADRGLGIILYGCVGPTTSQWKDYAVFSTQYGKEEPTMARYLVQRLSLEPRLLQTAIRNFPRPEGEKSYTRTPGPRQGRVNDVKLYTNRSCGLLKDPSDMVVTQEWIIIGERNEIFSKKGDSG